MHVHARRTAECNRSVHFVRYYTVEIKIIAEGRRVAWQQETGELLGRGSSLEENLCYSKNHPSFSLYNSEICLGSIPGETLVQIEI